MEVHAYFCEQPFATNLALKRLSELFGLVLIRKIHLHCMGFRSKGKSLKVHIYLLIKDSYSLFIAYCQSCAYGEANAP